MFTFSNFFVIKLLNFSKIYSLITIGLKGLVAIIKILNF